MKIRYTLVYNYLRTGRLKKDGTASLSIRAYLNGSNKYFKTGIYLKPKQWNEKAKRVINHTQSVSLNSVLADQLKDLEAFECRLMAKNQSVSLEGLLSYRDVSTDNQNLISFIDSELAKSNLSKQSLSDNRQTLDKLISFNRTILISEISFNLIHNFNKYLLEIGLATNTIAKHHKNLKKFIRLTIKLGYLEEKANPYLKFKVKREPSERLFLTENELSELELLSFKKGKEHWELILDFFLFCCYTGLRYSDACRLTAYDFTEDSHGNMSLFLKSQKTKKSFSLPLSKLFNGKPADLIKRYLVKNDVFYYDDPDNPVPIFFGLSNQYVNREIKGIVSSTGMRPKLKASISIHVARHTFGTIMAGKVRMPILQQLMQHSRIKETMIYVHLNQNIIDNALDKVEW